jgi:hypothetical protein
LIFHWSRIRLVRVGEEYAASYLKTALPVCPGWAVPAGSGYNRLGL